MVSFTMINIATASNLRGARLSIESKQRVEKGILNYGRYLSQDVENQFGGEKRNPMKVFMGRP
jgi:hypothetical protein